MKFDSEYKKWLLDLKSSLPSIEELEEELKKMSNGEWK